MAGGFSTFSTTACENWLSKIVKEALLASLQERRTRDFVKSCVVEALTQIHSESKSSDSSPNVMDLWEVRTPVRMETSVISAEAKAKRAKEERKARHKAFLIELQDRLEAAGVSYRHRGQLVGWVARSLWRL